METNNKLREALMHIQDLADALDLDEPNVIAILDTCRDALAEPIRNCDVGTAQEQESRWKTNCGHGIPNCKHCKVYEEAKNSGLVNGRYFMRCDCRFIWAQMPYEEGGAQ